MRQHRFGPRHMLAAGLVAAAFHAHADSSGKWLNSQEVYRKVCANCHEVEVGPVLTGRNLPPEYIRTIVRTGHRAMPAFRPTEIDDATLASVAQLIASSAPAKK